MSTLIVAAALVPAGLAACCIACDPHRRSRRVWVPTALMLVAMTDAVTIGAVAPVAWCAILVVTGMWAATGRRAVLPFETAMRVHRAMACIAMAALMLGHGAATGVPASGHAHGATVGVVPMVIALGTCVLGLALTAIGLRVRGPAMRRIAATEPALMAASVAAMLFV